MTFETGQPGVEKRALSRRRFLNGLRFTPLALLPAPLRLMPLRAEFATAWRASSLPFGDFRFVPHYPAKSPLEDVLRYVVPGTDGYSSEKHAYEIGEIFKKWGDALKGAPAALEGLTGFLDAAIQATNFGSAIEKALRSDFGIEIVKRSFGKSLAPGRERFLGAIKDYFARFRRLETADFEVVGIEEIPGTPGGIRAEIRYDFAGTNADGFREERIGLWTTRWVRDASGQWRVIAWEGSQETLSRARTSLFADITEQALGRTASYQQQLLRGVDEWRTVLDGACGIDVYGNNGLAVGDFNNDGLDDLYVCQPAGLPNRLYRNRGDGTFEDATGQAGVGVLDATACALFADFENRGLQDLLVVCDNGPLLFLNQGNGKYALKRDAFEFARPPQGTFTHAAAADYDGDGRLDVYFCVYSYYAGLEQYRYPVPYFDARNGPPNFLFHNEGNARFLDRTKEAGLDAENDRYSFACAWGVSKANGLPDLYVANDFGRSNLYQNNGNGTFGSISADAHANDAGAGMSVCWFDFDNDGRQDVYVSNMWSAAGMRVSGQEKFHGEDKESVRALYRQHARGNSLYRNLGNGKFQNVADSTGTAMGRWAWSSDSWDFDHDGYADLYIANGYITGPQTEDLASFFWRQVVAKSPAQAVPSPGYELGWNAINEQIRSDASWNGRERNTLYANNRDGTFSEISGIGGLDFRDDSRSFALADVDGDGRLEVILKSRTAPQIRILHNNMREIGRSIAFRLHGKESNRDAIGAAVSVEAGDLRQTKYVQAGSGFLSQHTKDVYFGIGKSDAPIRATIRWPRGGVQGFDGLPTNHRIEIDEGSKEFSAKPFVSSPPSFAAPRVPPEPERANSLVATWLIDPISAPDFSLPGLDGRVHSLRALLGGFVLLNFWSAESPLCHQQLRLLAEHSPAQSGAALRVCAVHIGDPGDLERVKAITSKEQAAFPVLLGTHEVAGIYNIIYRYMFDRRRNLPVPVSFLLDQQGVIVRLYQGVLPPETLAKDLQEVPLPADERVRKALPFPGELFNGTPRRNQFTYGVAFFQRGYFEQAAESFKRVIALDPQDAEANYNLGTLYLRRNDLMQARKYLEEATNLRLDYPEAWNNLGMVAAQEGHTEEAVQDFRKSLSLRPDYTVALLNLGSLYRREGDPSSAEKLLNRALETEPDNPDTNYNLGMLYAREGQLERAERFLQNAVKLRPDYPDALNNLGVLYVQQRRPSEAEEEFKTCIQIAPDFDQAYLNLARLYALSNDKPKARSILQDLLRRRPDHKLAQQALEMLN